MPLLIPVRFRFLYVAILSPSVFYNPPTHNQGPYDMSLSVVRHNKPLLSPPVTKA